MAVTTKRITMTDTAWAFLRRLLETEELDNVGIDCSDALTALAEAETIAVSETYALPDTWLEEARKYGKE